MIYNFKCGLCDMDHVGLPTDTYTNASSDRMSNNIISYIAITIQIDKTEQKQNNIG